MKLRPAGEAPSQKYAIFDGPMPRTHTGEVRLQGAKRRPCARCGQRFQPTQRRRMLCAGCFGRAGGSVGY